MKKQLDIFFTALMFFTRIPVPRNIGHGSDMLQKSARYFPLVGWVVGSINAIVWLGASYVFPPTISLLLMMVAGILTTGAFHEDGFADVCDAFGGGWTKEKILLIMKDSRLGTYGVTGLLSILAVKFAALITLAGMLPKFSFPLLLIAAHAGSRLSAVSIMQQYTYVTDADQSKSKPLADRRLHAHELVIALVTGLLPLALLPLKMLVAVVPVIIARMWLGRYFNKWIGGYTGDCLGATQQVAEVVFYLSCILVWKYI
ncbi:adenosylcobinamide-GDP ribazoletransferase [Deminuibacter soli]|uniref:Adenosylcobinamide-GDP ribazoletransferase n=1 Tax=Deminuibacter soli TaxID=2291815 RepID=A0A3E1NF60_9BACT|nr:adenosylcobinamide-GDP ribazoletransferase [Deminuibacter soli]RFM26616.1 adenosylcobinamide-GDP ribazoletransferase [Deminuibacter soli]